MDPAWLMRVEPVNKESLLRLEAVFGVNISSVSPEGLEKLAFDVFYGTGDSTYPSKVHEKNLSLETPGEHNTDGIILFYVLEKLYGKKLTAKDLAKDIEARGLAKGYFAKELVEEFSSGFSGDKKIDGLWGTFHGRQQDVSKKNAGHLSFDAELRKAHQLPSPSLLDYQHNLFDLIPVDLAFMQDGRLAILSYSECKKSLELEVAKIEFDNRQGSSLSWQIDEGIAFNPPRFIGIPGCAGNFDGSVSVGSEGIIYVVSADQIFRFGEKDRLIDVIEEDLNFRRMLNAVRHDHSFPLGGYIYQITKSNESFLISGRQRLPDDGYHDTLFRISHGKVVGSFPVRTSPSGMHMSCSHDFPRFSVGNGKVYIRDDGQVLGVDASLSKKGKKNVLNVANHSQVNPMFPPANQCVDALGRLWVVDMWEGEEASSIKCYSGNSSNHDASQKAVFLTHVYPENHPGGWPSLRKMAISPQGIMAYTDCVRNCINFYKLPGFEA